MAMELLQRLSAAGRNVGYGHLREAYVMVAWPLLFRVAAEVIDASRGFWSVC
jgi:hypothetical protein